MLQVLDFAGAGAQKQGKVRELSPNLYSRWRFCAQETSQSGSCVDMRPDLSLQESAGHDVLTEQMLQLIWQHQRIRREELRTVDGWPVIVLHPGFLNRGAGPDFRGAVIQLGAGPVLTGDVEVDLVPSGWRGHGHVSNPAYRNVILHVVWDTCASEETGKAATPILALKSFLDSPLRDLKRWLGRHPSAATTFAGQCFAPLKELPVAVLIELLRQAALIRLQAKAAEFEARARQVGWEQALWQGLFGALGYKHNVWPMRRLAELTPGVVADLGTNDPLPLQAQLFGIGGLLPADVDGRRPIAQQYVRSIWDIWWRQRERFADVIFPNAMWKWAGIRPANHPQRRLALAAHWLAASDFISRLENWFAASTEDSHLVDSLLQVLQVGEDGFWSWHWTMDSPRLRKSQPLIGPQRTTDLAMNVLLPWFWMRAVAGKNEAFQAVAEHRYFAWPRAEDNSVLRLARQRLFGGRRTAFLNTAAAQQGLLQIVRDFCDQTNALCEDCKFPELVKELGL